MTPSTGAGIDMVSVSRFAGLSDHDPFVLKTFTPLERAYCFSHEDSAPRLAGTFAAKEASWKALATQEFPFFEIEIRRAPSGKPEAWRAGVRFPLHLSITHTDELAAAFAIAYA